MKTPIITLFTAIVAGCAIASATAAAPAQQANADGTGFAGVYAPSKSWQPPRDPKALEKLKAFQDLKFGFFICWGTQTQFGTIDQSWALCPERYPWNKRPAPYNESTSVLDFKKGYEAMHKTFNPVKFDPKNMADLAADAGFRYMVFVTKHHDGFCFWDTKTTDYKITSTTCAFHKNPNANVTAKLFDAFRAKGFPIGVYFSKSDWYVPTFWAPQFGPPKNRNANYNPQNHPEVWKAFKDYTWAQMRELLTDYGPVDILWLDGGQVSPRENNQNIDMPGIARMARELQPGLLVVDRTVGGGYEDFLTPEGTSAMPKQFQAEAWEACIHFGDVWGWTRGSSYHSAGTLVHYLVRAVARNGNLLLGIGPDDQGQFDPKAVQILTDVGAWLKVNGKAIYGTRPLKPYEQGNMFFTRKPDGTAYAIVLRAKKDEPMPTVITIPASIGKGRSFKLLGAENVVLAATPGEGDTLRISIPAGTQPPCEHAWTLEMAK